jgi:ABC-type spermidine/putrescine transport system permease subunit I
VLGHVLICMPYSISVLTSGFEGFDRSLEEASADLGETAFGTFRRVTLPMVAPAIISSLLVAFTISLDEFIMAFFLDRHGRHAAGLHLGPAALCRQAAGRAGARHAAAGRLVRSAHRSPKSCAGARSAHPDDRGLLA